MKIWLTIVLVVAPVWLGCKRAAPEDVKVPPLRAALDAPEGKTACETLYNAYKAFDEAAGKAHMPPSWKTFPPRDTFMRACEALPPAGQQCLVPKNAGDQPKCGAVLAQLPQDPAGQKFYALLNEHP